ncbi:MAG: hypothetical protein J5I98_09590 [Phaeodactylibacter sp.]|nr:hypothetical protein [Phaeodactylibacter sp.]
MTIETKKLHLIKRIMEIDDESIIDKIDELVGEKPEKDIYPILIKLSKPIEKKIDIEKVKKEQNFQPIDKDEINRLIKEADIQEPIEELLEMI